MPPLAERSEAQTSSSSPSEIAAPASLAERYHAVRQRSDLIAEPLEIEDMVIQSMPDVSPTKWHLAHTTWFFETFVLKKVANYQAFDDAYEVLFNSYYNSVGEQFSRADRGLLSRPTVPEVFAYRRDVDTKMEQLFAAELSAEQRSIIEIGLHHEQQHQELMLTDIKHVLSINPLFPAYAPESIDAPRSALGNEALVSESDHIAFSGGLVDIGHIGDGFAYDNEGPRHQCYLQPFSIATQLVTNHDWQTFIADGGYRHPEFWTSLGWATVTERNWTAPAYWDNDDEHPKRFTLSGLQPVDPSEPVAHISWFEADAFARWCSHVNAAPVRLPTEFEWEHAASQQETKQLFGQRWQWTASPYTPYPGYRPAAGAIGEYNGKFMTQQYVLRGSSVATSPGHARPTYRNFFPPETRWQFSGLRLAKDG